MHPVGRYGRRLSGNGFLLTEKEGALPPPLPGQPAQGQRVLQPPLSTHIVSCQLRAHSQATWGARLFTVSTGPSGRQSLTWSHTGKTSPLAGGWYKKPQGRNGGGNAAQLPLTHRILSIQGRQGGQPAAGEEVHTIITPGLRSGWTGRHSAQEGQAPSAGPARLRSQEGPTRQDWGPGTKAVCLFSGSLAAGV